VRSLDHVRELQARLADGDPVVVIGSGFIGCEIAASLAMRGHSVSLVSDEPAPNRARLGSGAAEAIAGWLAEMGVTLTLNHAVQRIERRDGELHVSAGERRLRAPIVVMATGVAPRSELIVPAGIPLHDGAILVDGAMRTTVDGVLAAGDVTFAENAVAGRHLHVEHWGDALGQGAVAGRTAAGQAAAWSEVPGFWSTIGTHTLKYAAWGDGYDTASLERASDGDGFTIWYARDGRLVGVLAHDRDDDYARGRELIAEGAPWPG
jgi:3-phenylpropionate/trans-cinnamate dioxygenase ferredoxin reductase subunit